MTPPDPEALDAELRRLLDHAGASLGPVVILTGAGISAESGIPTFRGPEGYWTIGSRVYQPQELATRSAFERMPDEVWSWYLYRLGVCRAARPNAAHEACVRAERCFGERFVLITQNVDGLHLRAGSSEARTFQIHGNLERMRCAGGCTTELVPIPEGVSPKGRGEPLTESDRALLVCPRCGGRSRPHVLWFDETYDEGFFRFQSSLAAAERCRLLVVVGTSGATTLPQHVVSLACASGARVIDVNPDRNPFSQLAISAGGRWLQGGACRWLPTLVDHLVAASGGSET